jgi:phenylalanyl-tRNA synthetase beta chain
MNIKITHSWLLEYLDTKATPEEIQKYLSLCGPSVESVTKIKDDYIYDIEVTSNRVDTASVIGIAREAAAILSRFGIKSKFKPPILEQNIKLQNILPLEIEDNEKLCHRILAIVMDQVVLKDSPQYIKDRLDATGIRSLNNLVDITNYVMTEIGHPCHVFDYDRIKTHKFIIRNAKKDEEIITLDDKKYRLNIEDIIIDDGTGKVIDLPGIMGTANSVVTKDTKRIIFFIESNNPVAIRRSSMRYGIRTVAATINEKSPDPETAKMTLLKGIMLFQELANAKHASDIIDIYPNPQKIKKLDIQYSIFDKLIGVKIEKEEINSILTNLGFKIKLLKDDRHEVVELEVPSYRFHDISITQDIVEEVARIHGYFNLPNNMPPIVYVKRSKPMEELFVTQNKVKLLLKHLGLNEVLNYSMVSEKMINDLGFKIEEHLKLSNTLSEDIKYLRVSLIPSLLKNIHDNQAKKETLRFFELAKVYPRQERDLPDEKFRLTIAVNTDFGDLKGIVEAIFSELNIDNFKFEILNLKSNYNFQFSKSISAQIIINNKEVGYMGQVKQEYARNYEIKKEVFVAELDFQALIDNTKSFPTYKPITPYSVIKLDLTIEQNTKLPYEEIKKKAFIASKLLTDMELVSIYKNKLSLRFYFSSQKQNITEEQSKEELQKIKDIIKIQ